MQASGNTATTLVAEQPLRRLWLSERSWPWAMASPASLALSAVAAPRVDERREVVATSMDAEQRRSAHVQGDLEPLEELIRDTPGAHPLTSIGELGSGAFETDEELDEFLAFMAESRHADLA